MLYDTSSSASLRTAAYPAGRPPRHETPGSPTPAGQRTLPLDWARELVTPALHEVLDRLPEPEKRLVGYHRGWWGADGLPLPEQKARSAAVHSPAAAGGGKAVRPALALLGSLAVGGSAAAAVPAAVAVELVHDFSLLHDDVMDGDRQRRHRAAAWALFGTPAAVLAGDALLVLAVEALTRTSGATSVTAVSELTGTLTQLCQGQSLDLAFESRSEVKVDEYLAMAMGKTGSLLGCACALGAVLAGCSPTRASALRDFGRHLGVAFQCRDDLLGIWGSKQRSGKPVGADLVARKKSLPVAVALTTGGAAGRRLAALYARPEPLTEEEVPVAAELVERAGGRSFTESEAERQVSEALRRLKEADPEPGVGDQLLALAEAMIRRDH